MGFVETVEWVVDTLPPQNCSIAAVDGVRTVGWSTDVMLAQPLNKTFFGLLVEGSPLDLGGPLVGVAYSLTGPLGGGNEARNQQGHSRMNSVLEGATKVSVAADTDGEYVLSFRGLDPALNLSPRPCAHLRFAVDTKPPVLVVFIHHVFHSSSFFTSALFTAGDKPRIF